MSTPSTPPPRLPWYQHVVAVLRSIRRAGGLLWDTSPVLLIVLGVLGVMGGAVPAAMAIVGQRIIDGVIRAAGSGTAADRALVYRWVIIELVMVTVVAIVKRVQGYCHSMLRGLLGQRVSEMLLEKALTLSIADFEDSELQDQLNRARNGASYRPLELVGALFRLAESALSLGTFSALLTALSPWTVLLLLVATVPAFVADVRFSTDAFRLFTWRSPDTRRQAYIESVLTREDHAKEVKLFGLGPLLLGRFREIFWRFWREDRALTLKRHGVALVLALASSLAYYAAYGWIVREAMSARITLGALSMYMVIFQQSQNTLSNILGTFAGAWDDHQYLGTLFDFLGHKSAMVEVGGEREGTTPGDGIRFEGVSFTYPGAAKPALARIDLHVARGHKIALVGDNGAGKTTLIKLLTRLYAPTEGRITLDGRDLREWDPATLHKRIGVIFQDFARYQFTVGENIGVGDVTALDDEARWREAAEQGMADEFIDALPEKYKTQLGKWFPEGRELSLGQWQKIALSRAFMRKNADVLVLDEPTASMDAEAEARIFDRFRALAADRTAILISHRFSTVRMADTIAVLQDGRIIERGSHDELVHKGGRYAELFFLQARGYR